MIDFFTKQEKLIIVFLVAGLLIGGGIRIFHSKEGFRPNSPEELKSIEKQIIYKSKLIDSLLIASDDTSAAKSDYKKKQSSKKILPLKKIDINNADIEDLIVLPNVGPVLAERIIEYRRKNGNFQSIEALLKVRGIGEKKLAYIRNYIYINNK